MCTRVVTHGGSCQADGAKQRPRKARASEKADSVAVEVWQPPASGNVIMPAQKQEGLEADVAGIGIDTLVVADSVYNKELRYSALPFDSFARLRNVPPHWWSILRIAQNCSECRGSAKFTMDSMLTHLELIRFAAGLLSTGGWFTWHLTFAHRSLRYVPGFDIIHIGFLLQSQFKSSEGK